jgi:hypothetical protein
VVEGAPLLREYTRKGIEGSNPFFSAINPDFIEIFGVYCRLPELRLFAGFWEWAYSVPIFNFDSVREPLRSTCY